MKYSILEGKPDGAFNASNKARVDCYKILEMQDYLPMFVDSEYGVQKQVWKKPLQAIIYKKNLRAWIDTLDGLSPKDEIVIQYPLLNTTYDFDKFLQACKEKKVKTIALVHDVNSLRFTSENSSAAVVKRFQKEDKEYLSRFDCVIAHNPSMEAYLHSIGVKNIVNLQIFDYLCKPSEKPIVYNGIYSVAIAGNLDSEKAGYLNQIDEVSVPFYLYGIGYKEKPAANIHYLGAFAPEKLPEVLKADFGLVWDGNSLDGCEGSYGNYLKYNNPHKLSLYLASQTPVIVWSKSAEKDFVLENGVGIAVDSLKDLPEVLSKISKEDYAAMVKNTKAVQKKLAKGFYLKQALFKAEEQLTQ